MQHYGKYLWIFLLMAGFCFGPSLSARGDLCAICGKPISGTIYLLTDKVTGEQKEACFDCIKLPRCSICGLPVKDDGTQLPDGRYLCARDAKTVVLKADDARQICGQVKDDLDRLFSRFTVFPANVDIAVIDRVDVNSMFITEGNNFESPNLLGCIRAETANDQTRYKMSLLTGLPVAQLIPTVAPPPTVSAPMVALVAPVAGSSCKVPVAIDMAPVVAPNALPEANAVPARVPP